MALTDLKATLSLEVFDAVKMRWTFCVPGSYERIEEVQVIYGISSVTEGSEVYSSPGVESESSLSPGSGGSQLTRLSFGLLSY